MMFFYKQGFQGGKRSYSVSEKQKGSGSASRGGGSVRWQSRTRSEHGAISFSGTNDYNTRIGYYMSSPHVRGRHYSLARLS